MSIYSLVAMKNDSIWDNGAYMSSLNPNIKNDVD